MADESSKIPEKTVEQIFDERYPLDKWEDSNYSILDKFSMRGRKGFVTGAAGGLGRNAAAALAQAGADVALVDLPSQEDKLTELVKDMSERFGTNVIALTCDVTNVERVAELKTQLVEQLGTVDFAFLNAGVNVPGDEIGLSDWSSDVCSSDLVRRLLRLGRVWLRRCVLDRLRLR